MPVSNPIGEVAEADAPPDIARIYGEMRRLSGAPMVALVWRHMATLPGVLPEAWGALRPLLASGLVQEAAWQAAEAGVRAPAARIDRLRLAAAGIDDAGQAAFIRVLDAYNRVNPVNFVAVRLLVDATRQGSAGVAPPTRIWTPPAAIAALPPMAPVATIGSEQRRMLAELSWNGHVDRTRVVPSLYRHLTNWPGLIPLLHADLAPRFTSGEMQAAIAATADSLRHEAARLSHHMPRLPALAAHPEVASVLEQFSALIPEMVTLGLLLRRGLA